jgi:UDP:flavonoid glycosyltransferase YjiC (YdhE family)
VLLPAWSDCYDFANRVELLGVGRWANKEAKPRWSQKELSTALREVILSPDSEQMREKVKKLSKLFPENIGRDRAAAEILAALKES